MKDKRTAEQFAFDMAKHGWSFCNADMLKGKLSQLITIAANLSPNDKRHSELASIQRASLR